MLVFAIHSHPSHECPTRRLGGMQELTKVISPERATSAGGLEIVSAFTSCRVPTESKTHELFFLIEAPSIETVEIFFQPIGAEIKQVWNTTEIMKELMGMKTNKRTDERIDEIVKKCKIIGKE